MTKLLVLSVLLIFGFASAQEFYRGGARQCKNDAECPGGDRNVCVLGMCITLKSDRRTFIGLVKAKKCSTGADCGSSEFCADGKCVVSNGNGGLCSSDAFCPDDYTCIDSNCVHVKRHHFSLPCVAECPPGTICKNGVCTGIANFADVGERPVRVNMRLNRCFDDDDCGRREECRDGRCKFIEEPCGFAGCPHGECIHGKCVGPFPEINLP